MVRNFLILANIFTSSSDAVSEVSLIDIGSTLLVAPPTLKMGWFVPSPCICIYPIPSGPANWVIVTDLEVAPEYEAVTVAVRAATLFFEAITVVPLNVNPVPLIANVGVADSVVAVPVEPDV